MINTNTLRKNQADSFSIQDSKFCIIIEFMTFSSQKYSAYFNAFLSGKILLLLSVEISARHFLLNETFNKLFVPDLNYMKISNTTFHLQSSVESFYFVGIEIKNNHYE